jgi:hypothetical protein
MDIGFSGIGDPTTTVTPPPELMHPPDLEEFLSVKGSATFDPSASLDVWDLIDASQNAISPELWKNFPSALAHTCTLHATLHYSS